MLLSEKLLQHIWRYRLYDVRDLCTTQGEPVSVIHPGILNTHAGPDFLQARVQIGNTLLAGHVEIHLKTSDWERHGHAVSPAYGNLILHVVFENDAVASTALPPHVPTLELQQYIPKLLLERYEQLMQAMHFVPCSPRLSLVDELTWLGWKDRMLVERMQERTALFRQWLQESNGNWQEIFYRAMARSFGLPVNADAFEDLSRSLSVRILTAHKPQLPHLEALLLGQAGLLAETFTEEYPRYLQQEYRFFQSKYRLQPLASHRWKWLRMRPAAFPTIRLAQFAKLVHQSSHLFSRILEAHTIEQLCRMLEVTASPYWDDHYRLEKPSVSSPKKLGISTVHRIVINTVVPMLFLYGTEMSLPQYREHAMALLRALPAEQNKITAQWKQAGVTNLSAWDSQALLHLRKAYCDHKLCLDCGIGNKILRTKENKTS